ncbi:kelch domain-containing protein 4-like [Penaeus japonicus]|uniref:kelch domain-containing protein 4-like n=1 Tax=Penaeus japonicus TaxID=27405 RepID=UPI001C70B8C7|nr:kelch domain-containing protein 4-like [Penaeus japonicus]
MGKKDKKKGKGAEKTAAKTEKKQSQKLKKELAAKGEEDIDSLIAKFVEMDKAKHTITEDLVPPPSKRSAFSLTPHPDKDQLILFGGEYFNGNKTFLFNDLFSMILISLKFVDVFLNFFWFQGGGQLWVFGGEFTSQSQSQFHHFKDLWVFHFKTKKWEKIPAPGGPSARSGHRMVALKKNLIVFGGFHDNSFDCKYFNDVYAFNVEDYKWNKLEISGNGPCPRSACQMVPISDGRVLIYGGYSKQKLKKDVEKGVTHTDMYLLCPDKHDTTGLKWKWQSVKQAGVRPSPRCGFTLAPTGADKAILFGGVYDELDEEEELEGVFYNDMYQLDLMKPTWHEVIVTGKKEAAEKKKRRRKKEDGEEEEESEEEEEVEEKLENMKVDDKTEEKVVSDDGVFTVTVGPSSSSTDKADEATGSASAEVFMPPPRINAGMVVKKGILYLYGGIYEDGDKQLTLGDFYALDLNKLEEWQTIIPLNKEDLEWFESDSEDDEEDDESMDGDSEDEDEDEDGMDTG